MNGEKDTGDRGILMCFDEATGKFLWQLAAPKLKAGRAHDWELTGVCSCPAVDGDRVYVVSNRGELLCLDINAMANGNDGPFMNEGQYIVDPDTLTGRGPEDFKDLPVTPFTADIIWRLDMIGELGAFPHNAANGAPLVDGDTVYVTTSNGTDWTQLYVPSPAAPSVIAVNKKTGAVVWEDQLKIGFGTRPDVGLNRRIFHGQWSSVSLGEVAGRKQVYFGGGDGCLYALDAQTGKAIWWADCILPQHKKNDKGFLKYEEAEAFSEIQATPVFFKNRVYVANGRNPEDGEGVGVLTCLDATKTGDITQTGKLWVYDKIARSVSTCAIHNGLLFAADLSGFIHCLDPETGAAHWTHHARAHIWGSPLAADGKLYFGNEDGDAFIMEAGKTAKVLCKVSLDSPIYSSPAAANGTVYFVTQSNLFAVTRK
jgi:outer membrane protein assembly factor BamB